jgi:hypothetical protein
MSKARALIISYEKAYIVTKNKKEAEAINAVAAPKVEEVKAAAAAVEAAGKPLTELDAEGLKSFATPNAILEAVEKQNDALKEKVVEVRKIVSEQIQEVGKIKPPNGASAEAGKQLQQMKQQLDAAERQSRQVLQAVKEKCSSIVKTLMASSATAMRKEAAKGGADKLFEKLSKKADKIAEDVFCKKLCSLEGLTINADVAKLICHRVEKDGVSKGNFLNYIQLYYEVVRDIAFTTECDAGTSKAIRKAAQGEMVVVVEGPIFDEKVSVDRVKCRSLKDGTEGWMTVKGNGGTEFLQRKPKPFFETTKETPLQKDSKVDSAVVRTLKEHEILEQVGLPRDEIADPISRTRVRATKDNAVGWVTLKNRDGQMLATLTDTLILKAGVGMTDGQDIKTSNVVRKLAEGEKFNTCGNEIEDKENGVFRVEGVAVKDDKKGWITTRGNRGSVFAVSQGNSSKKYSATHEIDLQHEFRSNSGLKRKLAVGETFTVCEGPREEKALPVKRIEVRALAGGETGWITSNAGVKKWNPRQAAPKPAAAAEPKPAVAAAPKPETPSKPAAESKPPAAAEPKPPAATEPKAAESPKKKRREEETAEEKEERRRKRKEAAAAAEAAHAAAATN